MTRQAPDNGVETGSWIDLVSNGLARSIAGLSEMVGQRIDLIKLTPNRVRIDTAAHLFGGPEALTVVVYLGIEGSATGHIVLVYQPKAAFELVDMLVGVPPGSTSELGEMERSALGEMGNIVGSFFLNTLADSTGLRLMPTPPAVIMDMAGAVLDAAFAEMLEEGEEAIVVEASFGIPAQRITGTFLAMPSRDLQRTLMGHRIKP